MPGHGIEIGIAAAGVDSVVPDPEVCQAGRAVDADRYVSGDIGHVVVDAGVPAQRELRHHISKAPRRVADIIETRTERDGGTAGPVSDPVRVPAREALEVPYDASTLAEASPP